ncbi:MAG: type VI secretion system Vgr family protein [Gemmatimonadaceae bacterium]
MPAAPVTSDATQKGREFRVSTALGEDVLLLERFSTVEAISSPYVFTLDMVSADMEIDPEAILRTPASVTYTMPDLSERTIHGQVRRFTQMDIGADGMANYRAELVPWLWFLSLSSDCRVFQKMSVPEIVDQLFGDLGLSDYRWSLAGQYEKREYCVQYRETHLAFFSRLLEEEGIFYFFDHSESSCTLVLGDYQGAVKPCPGQEKAVLNPNLRMAGDDHLVGLSMERSAHTGKVALTDYNYLAPSSNLQTEVEGTDPEGVYDYPGGYVERRAGESRAEVLLESYEIEGQVVRGRGNCRAFRPGYRFELDGHYRRSLNGKEYMLLRTEHRSGSGGFRSGRGDDDLDHSCSFVAQPNDVPYRPPRVTARPIVAGSQTAVVVGPSGEEIWTDEHGRVKVQFHWDRLGKKDENSSCWVRVAQPWAGKGWGSLAIPRIGQEVVVEFLEGNPDLPLIVGSVYNADQTPPYEPKKGGVVSGLRSNTHKGSGYNEMSMDDTAGKEMITIHAQYDMNGTVEHDETLTVHNNRTVTVDVDHAESVGNDQTWKVGNDQTGEVGNNQQLTVGVNQDESVGTDRSVNVGSNDTLNVGQKQAISAGTEITLTVGAASITMKADGTIDVSGVNITVDGMKVVLTGKTEVSATAVASSMKATPASLELSAPMIKSAAMAINEISGAMVKLN